MRYQPLGTSGMQASVIGFGAWAIGGWMWGGTSEQAAVDALKVAMDAGINLIDTAPAYGLGRSEGIVGRAIRGRRERVVLATKCGLVWHAAQGQFFFEQDGRPVHRYLGAASLRFELEQSLVRLGTDYIDLYQTHWQDPTTPIEETMEALLELKSQGKIRAIGVSNADTEQMDRYRHLGPLDSDQERYSILDRAPEQAQLPYCRGNGMAFLAYSPLAHGLLTGKVGPERQFPAGDLRRDNPRFSQENRRKVGEALGCVAPIAKARGLTLSQLMLAWTVAQPGVSHALAGARNPQQASENARAGRIELSPEELEQIAAAFREV